MCLDSFLLRILNNRGTSLLIAYYVSTVFLALGIAFVAISSTEGVSAERQRRAISALQTAEAGMERALYDLRQDCINDIASPSWADGSINSMSIGPNTSSYYSVTAYNGNSINSGSYAVTLKNVTNNSEAIWVRSVGTVADTASTISAYVQLHVISPWHNAVFVGSGSSNVSVNGNIDAFGTVHLLGTSLSSSDYALELGGGSDSVRNNYQGMASSLSNKLPSAPTVTFNSESVESLGANLWVKNGIVGLSGSGAVGAADSTGNGYKETVDGTYVSDGFGGTKGTSNVNSDNGTSRDYILDDTVLFPSLSDAYSSYDSYTEYLEDNSLVLSSAAELTAMASITPTSSFSYSDANGSISMDGAGNLAISGKVYVDGGDLVIDQDNPNDDINYTGTGVIYTTGNATINVNLLTSGNNSFPTNIIGIMTPNTLTLDGNNNVMMGMFYGETTIYVDDSVTVAGGLVTNYLNLNATPEVYEVPDASNSLPAGLIGSDSATCYMEIVSWEKE